MRTVTRITDFKAMCVRNGRRSNDDGLITLLLEDRPTHGRNSLLCICFDGTSSANGLQARQAVSGAVYPAVGRLLSRLPELEDLSCDERSGIILGELRRIILAADESLRYKTCHATTMTVMFVYAGVVYCANVGDSPCFLIIEEHTVGLYVCHNRAGEMLRNGLISEEQAITDPGRNALLVSVNGQLDENAIAMGKRTLPERGILLIGSDGALANCTGQALAEKAGKVKNMTQLVETLYEDALETSGDNFTVAAAAFEHANY